MSGKSRNLWMLKMSKNKKKLPGLSGRSGKTRMSGMFGMSWLVSGMSWLMARISAGVALTGWCTLAAWCGRHSRRSLLYPAEHPHPLVGGKRGLFWVLYITHVFGSLLSCPWTEPIIGPVQNQNLPSRGPNCAPHLPHSALLALCKQENTLDIALDTLPSLVFISQVKECVTQTLQILQI